MKTANYNYSTSSVADIHIIGYIDYRVHNHRNYYIR